VGRASRQQVNVNVTGGDTLLVGPNLKRIGLIIGSPKVSDVWLNFVGAGQVGAGIVLHPGTVPLVLYQALLGDALVEEIHAISAGQAEIIGVLEFLR